MTATDITLAQILAIAIFSATLIATISGRIHRYVPALVGAFLVTVVVFLVVEGEPQHVWRVLNIGDLIRLDFWFPSEGAVESRGVNWQTIVFIAGMMIMVEGLGAAGFFRWLCLVTAKLVNYEAMSVLIAFVLLSGFLSMFIDSITVLLFLASVTIELARLMKFDPVPVIISEILAANIGGSATMCGDPPNIIIGTNLGYTFTDFALNTGPIAWTTMTVSLGLMYLYFRKTLAKQKPQAVCTPAEIPSPKESIVNLHSFIASVAVFMTVAVLLVIHAQVRLSVAAIGCVAAVLTLIGAGKKATYIVRRIDWRTLLFFFGLFVCVGGLEETGVLGMLAEYVKEMSSGSLLNGISLILWFSALMSAVVDNIPFTAVMVPVIRHVSTSQGMNLPPLAWALALGAVMGGNATPIGASANVVGTAIAEREGYPISWSSFCKYGLPITMIALAISHALLIVRHV